MTTARRQLALVALAAVLLLAAPVHATGTTVRLLGSAVVPEGPVTLAQVAKLTGPDAERLAEIDITDLLSGRADAWRTLDIAGLRETLKRDDSINWGRLTLRGGSTAVRTESRTTETKDGGDAARAEPAPSAAATSPRSRLRDAVEAQIMRVLAVPSDDIRITFDRRDTALLGRDVSGLIVEVRPTGQSRAFPIEITLYDGDRIVVRRSIRVDVAVRRIVAVAHRPVERGEPIAAEDVSFDERWIAPNDRAADTTAVVGSVASGRIPAGAIVQASSVEPPLVIRRGDLVVVHCVTPTVVIRQQARALSDAKAGETVELELRGSKRRVSARASESGRAVVRPEETYGIVRLGGPKEAPQ